MTKSITKTKMTVSRSAQLFINMDVGEIYPYRIAPDALKEIKGEALRRFGVVLKLKQTERGILKQCTICGR